ncbi:hypothetical protein V8E53_004373 [Lactarius tabidus]
MRVTLPHLCCAEAARVLGRALGGEHDSEARRVVAFVDGLDAEWVMVQRDWKEERHEKATEKTLTPSENTSPQSPSTSSSGVHAQARSRNRVPSQDG